MNKLYPWTVDTERVRLTYCLGHWHAGPSASVIILINSPFSHLLSLAALIGNPPKS
jgi:hypothetical protein